MSRSIPVGLGARAYDVAIGPGLIDRAGALLAPFLPRGRTVVVTDRNVADHHGERLAVALERGGICVDMIVLPPGEGSKSFDGLASLTDQLLALELDRGDVITAFGGGVVGDLTGFAAAVYKRGIGAFHQPKFVLADLDVLATLPMREVHAGYAEVIKYGLLGDFTFFEWLEAHGPAVTALDVAALTHAVGRSVEMKAEIVAEDEREAGRRALLNLGHTFAHALESETGYGEALLHGEAVGAGCALAFRFSAMLGHCSAQDAERAERGVAAGGLPTRLDQIAGAPFSADRLIAHMAQDKKAEGGRLTFVLARAVGDAFVAKGVETDRVRAFLISEALGWNIVPHTIVRQGPAGTGMVQLWVDQPEEPEDAGLVDMCPSASIPPGYLSIVTAYDYSGGEVTLVHADHPQLRRMALFDVVINNADRKGGHILAGSDGAVYGVDHGVCLHAQDKLRTVLWGWAGDPIDSDELAALAELDTKLAGKLGTRLRKHVTGAELAALRRRIRALITGAVMPSPNGRRPLPWPAF